MQKQVFTASVDESGEVSRNRNSFRNAIRLFAGREITVTVSEKRKTRSNRQNAYLWGVVYPLLEEAFYDTQGIKLSKEEVHEWCKYQFNYMEIVNEETGQVTRIGKSTTDNDTFNQEEYHEQIRRFAFEFFDTIIPLPNEGLELFSE